MIPHRLCDHSSKHDECLRDSTFDLPKAKAKLKNLKIVNDLPSISGYQTSSDEGLKSLSGYVSTDKEELKSLSGLSDDLETPEKPFPFPAIPQWVINSLTGLQSDEEIAVSEKNDSDVISSDEDKEGNDFSFSENSHTHSFQKS